MKETLLKITSGLMCAALSMPAQAASAWAGSEADLKFYKTYVNQKNCGESQKNYLACISSLQTLMASLDPEMVLKTQTTAAEVLNLKQAQLALNANNLKVLRQNLQAPKTDLETSQIKSFFVKNQKTKDDFKNAFGPAYYHFKVA